MHSSGGNSERSKLARHCSRVFPPLYTGITTEIPGSIFDEFTALEFLGQGKKSGYKSSNLHDGF
jgi:hypothetical protein